MKNTKTLLALSLLAVSAQGLSACRMSTPTNLNQNRVEVHESNYYDEQLIENVTDSYLSGLASHYARYGDGPMYISIAYDPKSRNATAMQATQKASQISTFLRRKGVRDLKVDLLPVQGDGIGMRTLTSYTIYNAQAPKDCTLMSGFEDLDHKTTKDYAMGCTVETVIARQIARPKDLKGENQMPGTTDSYGSYPTLNPVLFNSRNEQLGGESSSD